MPSVEISFLVRGGDGRCRTVMARTSRGALRSFLLHHRSEVQDGDTVDVKPRGDGEWISYRVKR